MDMQARSLPHAALLFAIAASFLVSLVYFPGLSGDYIFDDFPNLLENQALHLDNLNADSLLSASFSSDSGALKRPISMFSFALNYYFFGKDPFSFKVTNLVLHLANGIGLFIFTYFLLGIGRRTNKFNLSAQQVFWLPAVVALIWLVHPINLTSVLYIVQRMTSLSSFFMIYGLIFYVWYRNRVYEKRGNLYALLAGSAVFLLLAVFSKENGALFPLYLLLTESFLFRFKNADQQRDTGIAISFSVLIIVPLFIVLAWISMNLDYFAGGYYDRGFTMTERVLTEFRVLSSYLRLIVAPSVAMLGIFHDDMAISRSLLDPSTTWLSMLFIVSLLALAIFTIRRMPLLSFGLFWFFISHLLESTFIPLELMHEHRNYLASYGVILSITAVMLPIFDSFRHKSLTVPVAVVAVLAFSSVTFFRANQWASNINLTISEADHHPESPRATYAAARIYVKLVLEAGETKLGRDAMQRLETAIAVGEKDIKPDIARLIFASRTGLPIQDEWLAQLRWKLSEYPLMSSEVNGLKKIIQCQRDACKIPNEEIERLFIAGLGNKYLRPHGQSHAYIVTVYADFALNNLQDYELGERLFRQAIDITPGEPQYRINYFGLLIATGRLKEAEDQLGILTRMNTLGDLSTIIRDLKDQLSAASRRPGTGEAQIYTPLLGVEPTLRYD